MEAHRIHGLDFGDDSRDGDEVVAVVHPGYVALGSVEGEDYEKEKIWAKAVVLLQEHDRNGDNDGADNDSDGDDEAW